MNRIRIIWRKMVWTLKFMRRYFFTLITLGMDLNFTWNGGPNLKFTFVSLTIAILIDWVKSKFKPNNSHHLSGCTPTVQSQNSLNYHMVGTSTYLSNIGH